jgi:Fe2+ transport system protein FeoA
MMIGLRRSLNAPPTLDVGLLISRSTPVALNARTNPAPDEAVPLCELEDGECATVHAIHVCPRDGSITRCGCADCELLRAMGMTEQSMVRVCRGGRRCIIQVNATRLGISNAIARNILVSPIAEGA